MDYDFSVSHMSTYAATATLYLLTTSNNTLGLPHPMTRAACSADGVARWLADMGVAEARVRVLRDASMMETVVRVDEGREVWTWTLTDAALLSEPICGIGQYVRRAFCEWWQAQQQQKEARLPAERGMRFS